MPAVVLYFQIHQPHRLRRFSVFESSADYFDDTKNAEICRKVADKCYRPATRLLLDLVRRHDQKFRFAFSITGTALEQLESAAPDVVQTLRDLAQTGCCEFLAETYYHSLASVFSREEFVDQVDMHLRKVQQSLGITPTAFRNTELIYGNDLATFLAQMKDDTGQPRFNGCLAEGQDAILGTRTPDVVFRPPGAPVGRDGKPFGLLLRNYRLSDDIAFRFSNKSWEQWPLTAETFAAWVGEVKGPVCNLFMDFETIGEHQWADTGIFDFLGRLPEAVLSKGARASKKANSFLTPTQALVGNPPKAVYDAPQPTSWADTERDLSAWRGNQMQAGALDELFRLERPVKEKYQSSLSYADSEARHAAWQLLTDWRRLSTSDHFYYMSTKRFADGEVHKYFSPFESPYDAYINFMNVVDHLKSRLA
jgi:alpha-amylase